MIVPVGENILVEPIKVDEVTAGGIYLPDNARVTPDQGRIISVGDDVKAKSAGGASCIRPAKGACRLL